MSSRARVTSLSLLAGVFGVVLALAAWNSASAASPGQSGSSGQTNNHRTDPEIHHALHTLRAARHELEHARHDFDGHREAALHAVDDAIHQLEICLKTSHNGGGSSTSASNSSQWHGTHARLSSGS